VGDNVKMKYRGIEYKSETSLLEMKESDIIGKYRGSHWNYRLPKHIPQLQPKPFLTYRGVAYSTCPNATPEITNRQTVVTSIAPHSRLANTESISSLEELHLYNLKQNLERRIKVAQETLNDYLLEMLKQESQQLTIK
jgi:hypothetical protein